jgi:hypothetical protein
MAANTIWQRLFESTESDLVTIRLPRALAEELMSAISAGVDSGDGLDGMDNDDDGEDDSDDDTLDLDMDGPEGGDEDGLDLLLVGDDDEEEDDDDKDEAATYAKSGGSPSGMRPKTALGESRTGFRKLKGKLARQAPAPKGKQR